MNTQFHTHQSDSGEALPSSIEANLVQLIEELQSVDTTSALAELNATTISDNNDGRILL